MPRWMFRATVIPTAGESLEETARRVWDALQGLNGVEVRSTHAIRRQTTHSGWVQTVPITCAANTTYEAFDALSSWLSEGSVDVLGLDYVEGGVPADTQD